MANRVKRVNFAIQTNCSIMKQFFKMVFATMVGMLLFGLLTMFIGIMCIVGMVSSGNSSVKVRDNSVVVMNLSGNLNERSEGSSLFSSLTGQGGEIGLDDVLTAIRKAKDDEIGEAELARHMGKRGATYERNLDAREPAFVDFRNILRRCANTDGSFRHGLRRTGRIAGTVYVASSLF